MRVQAHESKHPIYKTRLEFNATASSTFDSSCLMKYLFPKYAARAMSKMRIDIATFTALKQNLNRLTWTMSNAD